MFLVNLPVALSVHRTTRKVFARFILGVTVEYFPVIKEISLNSDKVDSSKHPRVTCWPCVFIRDRGSRRTSVPSVGAQNNCAWMKILLDF